MWSKESILKHFDKNLTQNCNLNDLADCTESIEPYLDVSSEEYIELKLIYFLYTLYIDMELFLQIPMCYAFNKIQSDNNIPESNKDRSHQTHFISNLICVVYTKDVNLYDTHCKQYESVYKLSDEQIKILVLIRQKLISHIEK